MEIKSVSSLVVGDKILIASYGHAVVMAREITSLKSIDEKWVEIIYRHNGCEMTGNAMVSKYDSIIVV